MTILPDHYNFRDYTDEQLEEFLNKLPFHMAHSAAESEHERRQKLMHRQLATDRYSYFQVSPLHIIRSIANVITANDTDCRTPNIAIGKEATVTNAASVTDILTDIHASVVISIPARAAFLCNLLAARAFGASGQSAPTPIHLWWGQFVMVLVLTLGRNGCVAVSDCGVYWLSVLQSSVRGGGSDVLESFCRVVGGRLVAHQSGGAVGIGASARDSTRRQ